MIYIKTNAYFFIISHSFILRMRNISDRNFRETQNKHFYIQKLFFLFLENRPAYEAMWKNIVERGRPQMTIWRMRIACWIPTAINTQTHTHKHRLCSTHCFSTATLVTRTHLIVTLHVHYMSCYPCLCTRRTSTSQHVISSESH